MKRKPRENPNQTSQPCPKCSSPLYRRSVNVVRGSCWRCHSPMPIAFGNDGLTMMAPTEFLPLEIKAATDGGALLREHFSHTTQTTYLANSCQACGSFCGDFYLHDFWDGEPMVPPVEVVLGCIECFTAVAIAPAPDGSTWTGVIPHQEEQRDEMPPTAAPAPSRSRRKTGTAKLAKPLPASPPPAAVWGRCGDCGKTACPAVVTDKKFFCSQCRGIRGFVPDLL